MEILAFGVPFYVGDAVETKVIEEGKLPVGTAFFTVLPKEESIPHDHSEHEVWFLVKGEALVFCGEEQIRLKEKQVIKLKPNIPHKIRNTGDEILEAISIWWEEN
jgi:mannose-6-phosphate isomerase-like protein (cupin superfamily)